MTSRAADIRIKRVYGSPDKADGTRVLAREVCPPAAAERFIHLSCHVGESLELGISNSNGVLLNKGQRYFKDDGRSTLGYARESVDDDQGTGAQ